MLSAVMRLIGRRPAASSPGRRIASIVRHHRADLTPPTGTALTVSAVMSSRPDLVYGARRLTFPRAVSAEPVPV